MKTTLPRRSALLAALPVALLCAITLNPAHAIPLTLTFDDPGGDASPDLVQVILNFDNDTGDYELNYLFDAADPFVGTANFNLNILNSSISPLTTDPALVGINRFAGDGTAITELVPTALVTTTGNDLNLMSWNAGDVIANDSSIFGVPVDAFFGFFHSNAGDDRLAAASAVVTAVVTAVPEPATLALFGLGIFGMGLFRRKRR